VGDCGSGGTVGEEIVAGGYGKSAQGDWNGSADEIFGVLGGVGVGNEGAAEVVPVVETSGLFWSREPSGTESIRTVCRHNDSALNRD
jgi:hypothetical protein